MRKIPLLVVGGLLLLILVIATFLNKDRIWASLFAPTPSKVDRGIKQLQGIEDMIIADQLDTPWGMAELPGGDLLITERSGQVRRIGSGGATYTIDGVEETSEGGLLGLALHPRHADNHQLYLYFTVATSGGLVNRVVRYELEDDRLKDPTIILDNIPAAQNHDGGLLAFGPDGQLYVTTGDAAQPQLAQDRASLAGKILRLNEDGTMPNDNPFNNLVWSYGHRNPQGLAWDDEGHLWATEHGPSGGSSGRDELNLIVRGGNYGWPIATGDETQPDMILPVAHSGDRNTWAPGGIAYADGSLFFTGLRGQSVYQADLLPEGRVVLTQHLSQQFGRLRAIMKIEDSLIVGTSNRDGRGEPAQTDDRLIRIPVSVITAR
jgi:aldose sugar dehydrogenase